MVLGALVIVIVGILVVNYFKDRQGSTLPEALQTTNPVASLKAEAGKSHTVKTGETLWSIAQDAYGSGYNWVDIYKENKLTKESLEAGQVLAIPQVTPKTTTIAKASALPVSTPALTAVPTGTPIATTVASASPSASPTTTVSTSNQNGAGNYTVAKGDSLWKIAVAQYGNGYKWVEIAKANKLVNPNVIHPGNVLVLPSK